VSLLEGVDAGPMTVVVVCVSLCSSAPINTSISRGKISRPAKSNTDDSQGWDVITRGLVSGMSDITAGC
jgi:hypothetical protein